MRLNGLYIISLLLVFAGCSNKQEASGVKTYFNISGFFSSEAERLQKVDVAVLKTVVQNGRREQKMVDSTDWKTEFELFSNSDINKPAWQKSYKTLEKSNSISYIALDKKLRTKTIKIEKSGDGKTKHIYILNEVDNMLYSTKEELNYYPDSLYQIAKSQEVLILGDNNYKISGLFKKN